MKYYYADSSNQSIGPQSLEALHELYVNGRINDSTQVTIDNPVNWKPFSEFKLNSILENYRIQNNDSDLNKPVMEKYSYHFRLKKLWFPVLFCFLLGGGTMYWGGNDDRGMVIDGIIHLNPSQAKILLMICGGLLFFGSIYVVIAMIFGRNAKKEIILTDKLISFPKSPISSQLVEVPLNTIKSIRSYSVYKTRYIELKTSEKKYVFQDGLFESNDDFVGLYKNLEKSI